MASSPNATPTLATDPAGAAHRRLTTAAAAALASIFVLGHVPMVRETLDGIDSTNFILAIDGYDPR